MEVEDEKSSHAWVTKHGRKSRDPTSRTRNSPAAPALVPEAKERSSKAEGKLPKGRKAKREETPGRKNPERRDPDAEAREVYAQVLQHGGEGATEAVGVQIPKHKASEDERMVQESPLVDSTPGVEETRRVAKQLPIPARLCWNCRKADLRKLQKQLKTERRAEVAESVAPPPAETASRTPRSRAETRPQPRRREGPNYVVQGERLPTPAERVERHPAGQTREWRVRPCKLRRKERRNLERAAKLALQEEADKEGAIPSEAKGKTEEEAMEECP
ncbi:serine/arginine repetitive matrix protein 1-like [Diachasma alloeum]|uniref:serine/arginine repetitive matrix protein 1-like n=1 Tax=Diachasma alloeum TaxID=454923 RepID=UPI00073843DA|nr:serine/arginine repetitive matrix protein 1-like [Diachasma alloeum]